MSAVTLETLRADFDATQDALDAVCLVYRDSKQTIRAMAFNVDQDTANTLVNKAEFARNILDVAEKHGLEAAMLYKLSGGNIDPRVSA
ncbi:hypothetical protein MOP88_14565 [Sphingomonas sp. WKB10]|nr:hypothetical protein [Sphingomonas sp. WKB10]